MALITGTTTTYPTGSAAGLREDLEDVIWDLFPEDTWLLTNSPKVDGNAAFHEWLGDNLAGATANRQLEGDDATYTTIANPTRFGNYHQISRKTFLISRTLEKVAKAGRKSEIARQTMKQMRELKRDMEQALVGNQASSTGGAATARSTGGMESWIASTDNGGNGVRATTTASASTAGFASGVVTAPTDGTTTGALTQTKFDEMLSLVWADGADPSVVLAGSTQKTAITGFTSIATRFIDQASTAASNIIQAVDWYVSNYGKHKVVLHRYIRGSVVIALDPDMVATSFIDRPFIEELAKTGDGRKYQLVAEYSLVVRNPNALGKVAAAA